MLASLTKNITLLQSFETAALSVVTKKGVVSVPAPANGCESTTSSDSIFRTTEK